MTIKCGTANFIRILTQKYFCNAVLRKTHIKGTDSKIIFYKEFFQDKFKQIKRHAYWPLKIKVQPALLLSSFAHYSCINENMNMQLG